ncbi:MULTISPECIES: hypothetical protein [unclassified Leucobacter]|uniref:hypothetical protein n=1 Tax=unclassified Leucobacter TaxID=2621730 RepID=UPI00165E5607|nr:MULTISPECIES: hypothetical protein [unclassified Leucobacter]MBC9935988.1 hypothetical protein [Leucobacter sp. cx-87]
MTREPSVPRQSSPAHSPQNNARHLFALAAGMLVIVVSIFGPSGIAGYLLLIGMGIVAVAIGHRSLRHPGPLLWAAIVGLVLGYLELIMAVGLLTVRLTRIAAM